jgi:hypothetical protein
VTIEFGIRGGVGECCLDSVFNISRQINAIPSVRLHYASGCDILAINAFSSLLMCLGL